MHHAEFFIFPTHVNEVILAIEWNCVFPIRIVVASLNPGDDHLMAVLRDYPIYVRMFLHGICIEWTPLPCSRDISVFGQCYRRTLCIYLLG